MKPVRTVSLARRSALRPSVTAPRRRFAPARLRLAPFAPEPLPDVARLADALQQTYEARVRVERRGPLHRV